MTWISLVCLLALSSSAFGRSAYGSGYGGFTFPQFQNSVPAMREQVIHHRAFLPSLPSPAPVQSGYGQQKTVDWTPSVQRDIQIQPVQPISSGYGSSYGAQVVPKTFDLPTQGYGAQVLPKTFDLPSQGYGAQVLPKTFDLPTQGYGAQVLPKTFDLPSQGYGQSSQGYGSSARLIQMDQPAAPILSPADILCRGQRAESVIPLENGRKFVVCTDESKGDLLECPKGLFYHPQTRRCERKLGPLDDFCASQPCLNGGQCVATEFSYQCQCPTGYDGKICELDARVCQTQQPCGQSPDFRCQSFRWGAALTHICIHRDSSAYGLDGQRVQPSPCGAVDGPQALAVTDKGFIMCDGERMFVESCPGGTIWDDGSKACVWPGMQEIVVPAQRDLEQPNYGLSYGQQRPIITAPSYGSFQTFPTRMIQQDVPKFTQSYGAQVPIERPQFDMTPVRPQPEFSSYGGQQFQKPINWQQKLIKQDLLPSQPTSAY
jgi:hypothetical protein